MKSRDSFGACSNASQELPRASIVACSSPLSLHDPYCSLYNGAPRSAVSKLKEDETRALSRTQAECPVMARGGL